MNALKALAIAMIFAATQPVFAQEKNLITVPFDTLASRHMIVDVKVNGKGPFTLIFDTGAPLTLISGRLAREAKIPSLGGLAFLFGGLGQQKIDSLEFGDIQAKKVDAIVMDHPIVDAIARATGKTIDGIVGFNVFGRYVTTIDYQAKTLSFTPSEFQPVNMIEAMMKMMSATAKEQERVPVISPRSLLGIAVEKSGDDAAAGVVVERVFPGSPAARAGVKVGDRLLSIDGRWTDSVADCAEALRTIRPGETASLEIIRDGTRQMLKATLAAGI